MLISIDAMGGDSGAAAVLAGCAIARRRHPDLRFLLHGDEAALQPLLKHRRVLAQSSEIRHVPGVVAMSEKPSQAVRRGRNTSMWHAIEAVASGECRVAVSAGNTGALMAISMFRIGLIEGISRPAIAVLWPTMRGHSVVLDVGANAGSDADQLVDFAVMGEAFARAVFGIQRPTVGLLNIGEEEVKGIVDVVVTDGFTGNVALKTAEGTAELVMHYLRNALKRSLLGRLGAILASGAFRVLKRKLDPRTLNGGVFLGLNGVVVKSHGGADALGFASAIDLAIDMGQSDMIANILADRAGVSSLPDAPDAAGQTPTGAAAAQAAVS